MSQHRGLVRATIHSELAQGSVLLRRTTLVARTPGIDLILEKNLSFLRPLTSGLAICVRSYFGCPEG